VQTVREPKQPVVLAAVAFIEYIARVDIDLADDGPGRFELAVAGQTRGSRFLDARVFLIGELCRKARFGQGGDKNRKSNQPATVGQFAG
jgi:hypothetical protein